jgi:hypothetical protein
LKYATKLIIKHHTGKSIGKIHLLCPILTIYAMNKELKRTIFWGVFIAVLLISSCKVNQSVRKTNKVSYIPYSKTAFIEKPFGYAPSIKNFTKNLVPPFKIQRFVVANKHNPKQNDTIIKFYKGKSQLFIYKTKFNQELFFAGNICHKNIVLCNGVKVGMSRGEFYNSFIDLKYSPDDTVKIMAQGPGDTYAFIFKNDKIVSIGIQHYID